MASTEVAEMVEAYLSGGLSILPLHTFRNGVCTCGRGNCPSPAKHPRTQHGKDDATTDPGLIAEWLGRWPDMNIGVRPPEGVIILDVDPRNGGATTMVALQNEHGELPITLTARTGSGGLHIWLTHNGPTRGRLGTGIDVKTNSGYVVAPPSVHACGGSYEWINEAPAAYAPRWVKNILNPPQRVDFSLSTSTDIGPLVRFVTKATDGERNRSLFWAACRAAEKGVDPEPLLDAALSIGLGEIEARNTIRSAVRTVKPVIVKEAS